MNIEELMLDNELEVLKNKIYHLENELQVCENQFEKYRKKINETYKVKEVILNFNIQNELIEIKIINIFDIDMEGILESISLSSYLIDNDNFQVADDKSELFDLGKYMFSKSNTVKGSHVNIEDEDKFYFHEDKNKTNVFGEFYLIHNKDYEGEIEYFDINDIFMTVIDDYDFEDRWGLSVRFNILLFYEIISWVRQICVWGEISLDD